ncbi:hypothetical protein GCM10007913_15610 [Devosia yakushimensis]|uniref:YdhG-like domain-containing protein n=1 Tax=Devosia yakushimensis TaxID=470028 RepID=A0ABQ5UCP3_9HYPH|nr:DUF1801 domain-containing protein [Devosia yakushimensis]GLQ09629.1 hypothetical protein GCM10007913_15610 [Devosia yakushimensis]
MAGQKTMPDTGSVDAFLAQIEDPARRADSHAMARLLQEVSGEPPVLWGTMIGFGRYHYKYASGHEGDAFLVGFAPRKTEFSIYLMGTYLPEETQRRDRLLARLGKHRMGKACLYVKRLSDIDLEILRQLAGISVETLRRTYPGRT